MAAPTHQPTSTVRLRLLAVVLAVLAGTWVLQRVLIGERNVGPVPRQAEAIASRPLAARKAPAKTLFTRMDARETGIDFTCPIDESHPQRYLYETGFAGGGVAIGDVDRDGRPDVYLVSGPGVNRLYRQVGDFRFEDVTAAAGVDGGDAWGGGAAMADVNNDGYLDLYVCNYDAPNQLFINRGDGTFRDEAAAYGVAVRDASLMAAFCDYDLDADLDMYLLTNRYVRPEGRPAQPPVEMVNGQLRVKPEFEKYYALSFGNDLDDRAGRSDALFRNNGDGSFSDVSAEAGLWGRFHGLSVTWCDYNEDGWPDVYVANDFNGPDQLFRNQADGTFVDVTRVALPRTPWFSMGSDAADVNNDGHVDLLVGDMARTTHETRMTSMGPMNGGHGLLDTFQPPQTMWNVLLVNTGVGRFLETAYLSGLASTDWTWAVKLADFDNDARVDAFFATGFTRNFSDDDHPVTTNMEIGRTTWEVTADQPELHNQNFAFRNLGELQFADVSRAWGLDDVGISMAAAYGDLDRDGDLDLIVGNVGKPVSMYRNDGSGHAVLVSLDGAASNRLGLGAEVRVRTKVGEQVRWLSPMTGYSSSNDPVVHVGLGTADRVEELVVEWPSGHRQTFRDLPADRWYTIAEPDGPPPQLLRRGAAPTMWALRRETLAEAVHHERPFDDFQQQRLLPHQLSQLGPALAWADVEGDGDDDMFLGGAAGSPGSLWLNQGGGQFAERPSDALVADQACEDMGAVWFDADADGDVDLFVVSGGVEFGKQTQLLRDRLYWNDGSGGLTKAGDGVLPALEDSGGPAAAADYDRDGDVDVFVGGRVLPGQYPLAPASRLLRNDGGRFSDATESVAPEILHTGMVTSALWSDVDDDGWVDLLVAHEWGPVKCFYNDHGRLVDRTDESGLSRNTGWWNGLAGRDIDNDGDIDFVATNIGLNSRYRATAEEPLRLYYGDFTGAGVKECLEAYYEGGRLLPIRDRLFASLVVPWVAEKFPTHEAYGRATLEEIFTAERLAAAEQFSANTLESGVFLNDGRGRFEFRPLPRLAQAAPGFGAALVDADADGFVDLYLVQNSYSPQPGIGRMDGGMSLLLRGDGRGGFSPAPAEESGLIVPADAKSLAATDLNDDGWCDFVVGVNNFRVLAFERRAGEQGTAFRVRLEGRAGNTLAAGARVSVRLNDESVQTAEVYAGEGYLSQSAGSLMFAVPKGRRVVAVDVRWPSGKTTTQTSDAIGAVLRVNER